MTKTLPIADFPPTKGYINSNGNFLAIITGNMHRINSKKLETKDGWGEQRLVALERNDKTWDVFFLDREDSPGKGRSFTLRNEFSLAHAGVGKEAAVEAIQSHDALVKNTAPPQRSAEKLSRTL